MKVDYNNYLLVKYLNIIFFTISVGFIKFISSRKDGPICTKYAKVDVVRENRQKVFDKLNISHKNLIRVDIGHNLSLLEITKENEDIWSDLVGKYTRDVLPKYDGIICTIKDIVLEVNAADSGVYIFNHNKYDIIALINSGRNGSIEKILESAVKRMAEIVEVPLNEFVKGLQVEMAPAICAKNYVVDYILVDRNKVSEWKDFVGTEKYNVIDYMNSDKVKMVFENKNDKLKLDFIGYNKKILLDIGIPESNITISQICTYDSTDYPSYTKYVEGKEPDGRFMVIATMTNE